MAKEIKFFDHRDKPFGCLSNNYSNYTHVNGQPVPVLQKLRFGTGKPCNSLTNYIYASFLGDNSNKQVVCSAKLKNVKTVFEQKVKEEKEKKIKDSVQQALTSIFNNKKNTAMINLLLSTGNRRLFYISISDFFLGSDEDKKGQNWYGLYLEQERKRLVSELTTQQKQKHKENEDNIKYDTYLAQKGLIDAINKGDNLKKYIHRSSEQIVQQFGRETLSKGMLSREHFFTSFPSKLAENVVSYIEDPENMVHLIRKDFLPTLQEKRLREKKKQIFYMYADYLLRKSSVNPEQYQKAKEQQFSGKKFDNQAYELEDRLYNLYMKGMLSESLSTDIDNSFKDYYIPTDQEISDSKKYEPVKKALVKPSTDYVSSNTDPFYIYAKDHANHTEYKYDCFLPDSIFTPALKINDFTYLTVSHYIIEKLLLQLGVKNARSYILDESGLFRDLPDIMEDYEKLKTARYKEKLIQYATEGLKMKFLNNRVLEDYLLATGNATLVYNDTDDYILGTGYDSSGNNYVGKYLMELRDKLVKQRDTEEFNLLTTTDITLVLNNNAFMKDWVTQRVKDSCRTIITMNDYINEKFDTKVSLSANFVKTVLDNIYHPCSQIYAAVDQIKASVPDYFIEIVRKCDGMESAIPEIIDVLWKRIAVIIYYLIKHLIKKGAKIQDISSQIGRVQVLKSQEITCKNIVPDKYENCIIVALVNLIVGIVNFNIQNSNAQTKVTNLEVRTATSIILESIIPNESTKPKKDAEEVVEVLEPHKEDDGKEVAEAPDDLIDEAIKKDDDFEDFDFSDQENLQEDDEEGDGELDYDSGKEGSQGSNSPTTNKIARIVEYLNGFTLKTGDIQELATYINGAVENIKIKTKTISEQIKRNRVNFFAGHT